MNFLTGLVDFTWKQMKCCLFPAIIFCALGVTKLVPLSFIPRYDLLLIICLLAQILLILYGFETLDELKVIMMFHLIGLGLEIYKVQMGSWSYSEPGFATLLGVPLYSGFMYASVASYICRAFKEFHLRIENWPNSILAIGICVLIYANFFTHHFLPDFRYLLIVLVLILFARTSVYFTVSQKELKMPLSLSFLLIAFFIYLAENIASFFGAWSYPDQLAAWRPVHIGKMTSWFLLIIISIIIVAQLKKIKAAAIFLSTKHSTFSPQKTKDQKIR
ncbi:DUF817 domain-containing protein [Listeria ilorinensis]|uniref:DUF817 domain-containing protein n=1 Tax=Listeria ilorinensis TaxID=2867439 RepID=UPI001EF6110A|nr:DUF817 domain-containing protein [Listeria ilorinensis]